MKELLDKENLLKPAQVGRIIEGKVIGKARSSVFLDLGPLGTGVIYGKEFQIAKDKLKDLKVGEVVFAKIIGLENEEGYIELSLNQASNELIWEELKQKKDKGEKIMVKITGANKGGLLTEISAIPAFLPVSQLSAENYPRVEGGDTSKILKELQKFIGTEMELKIFDLDKKTSKIILSERAKDVEKIKEILKNFKSGDIVEGEITGITDFGAFVKFYAPSENGEIELEGLIHISELDWQLIEDPAEIVKVGEKVMAKIVEILDDKVSLSLRALKKDPWENIEKIYKKGDLIKGKVTKFNPFGAFVQILSGPEGDKAKIQGLCHISEFGSQQKMSEQLQMGENYNFQILSIEPKEHRMSLKLAE